MSQSFLAFLFAFLTAASPSGGPKSVKPVQPMSQEEMESRVRIDASRQLKVTFDDVRVVETSERTWPDNGLGCKERNAASHAQPAATSGFRIVVKANNRPLTYHTDRFGRVLQCERLNGPDA